MTRQFPLYPQPRLLEWGNGGSKLTSNLTFIIGDQANNCVEEVELKSRIEGALSNGQNDQETIITVNKRQDIHPQGYILQWDKDGLFIEFSEQAGLHYALVTIEQLVIREGYYWNFFRMEDEPDFPIRGILLDIGRNKIPKLETIYGLIDFMSACKLNHLQLYMEGFSFQYKKYEHLFPDSTPITAEEFRQLDTYAKSHYIDLVPNQNCFGHMGDWLAKEELRHLAENPDGLKTPFEFNVPPVTLNPTDDRSLELVKDLFAELLPNFSSSYVNINMDEPFGLGAGRSKELAEQHGIGEVYYNYAEEIFKIIREHDKKTLIWGDILTKYPDIISRLPKDVTILDWNYDGPISFEDNCKMLNEQGVPFYVCPGTSSWASISGRTDNMLENISDAAINGLKYGAEGMLTTDWGDSGHWQVPAISYPGFVYAAGVGWHVEKNLHDQSNVESYLSDAVFKDQNNVIGNFLMELGRYYHFENSSVENATYTNHILNHGLLSSEEIEERMNMLMIVFKEFGGSGNAFQLEYDYQAMVDWLSKRKDQLNQLDLHITDAATMKDELINTVRLVEQGIGLHRYMYKIDLFTTEDKINLLEKLSEQLEEVITEFNRLWLIRNRLGGLAASNKALYNLLDKYEEEIKRLKLNESV